MTDRRSNPWPHRTAWLVAVAAFPLIFMGGLVTSHGAGMSVPDWPNSYGYNMFTFPPSRWVGGIFYEHTHRLLGSLVGLLAIALAAVAWFAEPRRWVRAMTLVLLAAIVVQGVLGGLRVIWVSLDLAVVHACFAQAVFALAAAVVVVTSRWWHTAPDRSGDANGTRLFAWTAVLAAVVFAQLVVGALMRHEQAGLAIPDLPLAYGHILPPMNDVDLAAANGVRAWDYHLDPVTLGQVWLHFGHRVGALAVAAIGVAVVVRGLGRDSGIRGLAGLLAGLLVAQFALGVLTVLLRKPADIASLHVATGAVLLATVVAMGVRLARLQVRPTDSRAAAASLPQGARIAQAVPA